jgi:nicotinamidase-related amidase
MIDPKDVQVLFADFQKEIVARSKTNPPEALSRSAVVLAKLSKLFSLPVHFSVAPEGKKEPVLIPELEDALSDAPRLLRVSGSAFTDAKTRAALANTARRTLIVAGFATEVVVLHSVRDAIDAGYRVHVPVDACGGMSSRTEDAAFRRIEAAGGVTTSVATLAAEMLPDFSSPLGQTMLTILQECLQ